MSTSRETGEQLSYSETVLAIEREVTPFVEKWMQLEISILKKWASARKANTSCFLSFVVPIFYIATQNHVWLERKSQTAWVEARETDIEGYWMGEVLIDFILMYENAFMQPNTTYINAYIQWKQRQSLDLWGTKRMEVMNVNYKVTSRFFSLSSCYETIGNTSFF